MINTFDTERALEALHIDYDVRGNEASALCPMHEQRTGKEDHSPSWWINLETGQHMCFSCQYQGGLMLLVADLKGFYNETWGVPAPDWDAAKKWLAYTAEITIEELLDSLEKLPGYVGAAPKPIEMSEARLAVFTAPPADELAKRNVTAESAQAYGVIWNDKKKDWILPLREPHFNKLMGWQEKGTVERTFFNRPAGLQKSKTLFGVDLQNEDLVIVVESPLDCLRFFSAGIPGAVATCGAAVSEDQIKLLRSSEKIIVAFDNPNVDKAGKKASAEMLKWARIYGLNLFFFNYGNTGKKDPGDLTNEELRWGIDNAQSALFGESAYVQRDAQTVSG